MTAKTFAAVEKFNPYHDRLGRFSSAGAAASFTFRTKDPKKQHMADMAVAREKERAKNMGGGASSGEPAAGTKKVQLNQELVRRANDASMFNRGNITARDAQAEMDSFDAQFKPKADWTDEQKAYAAKRHDEYTELVADVYNDQLRRSADNPSWAVTGRAGRDMRRMERDTERQMRAYEEGKGKMERFKENTQKELDRMTPDDVQISYWRNGRYKTGETISADDPLATKKLQAKLEYQQESQQRMKDANAYYRKNGTMQGFSGFNESTNAKIDAQMNDMKARGYGSFGRQPFASYSLTNNNAQIKATRQRLEQQQKIDASRASSGKSGGSAGGFSFKGGNVVQNTGINRLQIKFDSIPDASMRAKLKSEGWRWSPREGAWQRQLTANAESSAKRILGSSMEKALTEDQVAKTFNESMIEKFNPYHDRLGRFSSASGAASMTIRTRSGLWQNAANRSVERAKQHHASTMPTAAQAKTLKSIESRTRNLKKEQFRVVDREGNVVMEKKGEAHSVSYSVGDAREHFPGNITIHNHPSGGTFSTADLSDIGYGATEIRAAAPEGTYVLRNTRYGQSYNGATTKTWYDMRNDIESAATEFKSGIALKKQVRSQFSKESAEIDELAKKGVEVMRSKGSDSPEFKAIHNEYTQKSDALSAQIKTATQKAYTDQYDAWYKSHAMEYGLEYEFIPAKSRTRKGFVEEIAMEAVTKARKGEEVLDLKLHEDVEEIANAIMQEILSDAAKVFNRKTA